jgi:hypothetical protein
LLWKPQAYQLLNIAFACLVFCFFFSICLSLLHHCISIYRFMVSELGNSMSCDHVKRFSFTTKININIFFHDQYDDDPDIITAILQVMYHPFTKEEQLEALEMEKKAIEERKRLKEAGVIGSTMDAIGGAASLVGSGVGLVGTGIVGGVGLVGSGLGAGAGLVGSGIGAVGSGLGKAGKFMGRTVTGHFSMSRKNGSSSTVPQPDQPLA